MMHLLAKGHMHVCQALNSTWYHSMASVVLLRQLQTNNVAQNYCCYVPLTGPQLDHEVISNSDGEQSQLMKNINPVYRAVGYQYWSKNALLNSEHAQTM